MLARADFNCPGGGIMKLDGTAAAKGALTNGEVHLDKKLQTRFRDEWDDVITHYMSGANDPEYITAVEQIAGQLQKTTPEAIASQKEPPKKATQKDMVLIKPMPVKNEKTNTPFVKQLTIEEKFVSRKKELAVEIPLSGDSVELRFYDNAEIDGDSISLFLNDRLIFSHIRLLASAYVIKLSVKDLLPVNELIMVAENLGSIPPNTSYMVAIVNNQRYEARLESTEGSSAMVRFVKHAENTANFK
jgi:hypothetical protein